MISENNLPKLCLIYGNQKLLVEETVDLIIDERLKDRNHEWALERFYSEELLLSLIHI